MHILSTADLAREAALEHELQPPRVHGPLEVQVHPLGRSLCVPACHAMSRKKWGLTAKKEGEGRGSNWANLPLFGVCAPHLPTCSEFQQLSWPPSKRRATPNCRASRFRTEDVLCARGGGARMRG